MYHCFGLVSGYLSIIAHGGAVALASQIFDPVAVIKCVLEERCTALHGVPAMWVAFLQHMKPEWDFSGVRTGISGGSPVPQPLMEDIQKRLKVKNLTIAYG